MNYEKSPVSFSSLVLLGAVLQVLGKKTKAIELIAKKYRSP